MGAACAARRDHYPLNRWMGVVEGIVASTVQAMSPEGFICVQASRRRGNALHVEVENRKCGDGASYVGVYM